LPVRHGHGLALAHVREGRQVLPIEVRGALGVGLQVERVALHDGDHAALVEDAVAAEHAARRDAAEALEDLVQAVDEGAHSVAFASGAIRRLMP
jgi:hypothetical protein